MMEINTQQQRFGYKTFFELDGVLLSTLFTNEKPTAAEIEERRMEIMTPDCDDCAFLGHRCGECDAYDFDDGDDGQPSWEQEWQDFGEVYSDEY